MLNIQVLHQSVSAQFDPIRPAIDHVFTKTITRVKRTGCGVNMSGFVTRLNTALRDTRIHVVLDVDGTYAESDYPILSALCYEPKNPGDVARIRITISMQTKANRIVMPVESWEYFRFRVLKNVQHELVHRSQYAAGRRESNTFVFRPHEMSSVGKLVHQEQTYLGELDEIEAYARDCVEEWYYRYPNQPMTMREVLKNFRSGPTLAALQYYHEAFVGDETHPSIKRFFRKVRQWGEVIHPLSRSLPSAPAYVKRMATPVY